MGTSGLGCGDLKIDYASRAVAPAAPASGRRATAAAQRSPIDIIIGLSAGPSGQACAARPALRGRRRPRILPGECRCMALAVQWVEWSSGLGLALVVLRGFGV